MKLTIMSELLLLMLTRYRLCLSKICLSFTQKQTLPILIKLRSKYRDSLTFLRSYRKFFSTFLTSFFMQVTLLLWSRTTVCKPNILTIKYVTVFLVLIMSKVLTPLQILH